MAVVGGLLIRTEQCLFHPKQKRTSLSVVKGDAVSAINSVALRWNAIIFNSPGMVVMTQLRIVSHCVSISSIVPNQIPRSDPRVDI